MQRSRIVLLLGAVLLQAGCAAQYMAKYEPTHVLEFRGPRHWHKVALDPARVQGASLQSVYEVDDAPRYAGVGPLEAKIDDKAMYELMFALADRAAAGEEIGDAEIEATIHRFLVADPAASL